MSSMKPAATYTMSDSEPEVEDMAMDFDNDDFIFNNEPINLMSSDDEQEFLNSLLSPVKVRIFIFIQVPRDTFYCYV